MQGILENDGNILNFTKILMEIIHFLGYKFKESWKIPEKNGLICDIIGYNTSFRLYIQGILENSRKKWT